VAANPQTKPVDFGCESPIIGSYHPHPPLPLLLLLSRIVKCGLFLHTFRGLSVCVLDTPVSSVKMAEVIEMCRLRANSCGPKEPLAPPDEYDESACVVAASCGWLQVTSVVSERVRHPTWVIMTLSAVILALVARIAIITLAS